MNSIQKILVMGLPGSGKTYFSKKLLDLLSQSKKVVHINADDVRKHYNDWDFSYEGRIRQSIRMRELADNNNVDYVISDFVAPLPQMRNNFKPDWIVWIDTIDKGRFADTNKLFVAPDEYDFRIPEQNADKWAEFVANHILENRRRPVFDWRKETVQMLGRWQPWHDGHRALFDLSIAKTGQVCIMVRDCQGWNQSNPFSWNDVRERIKRNLDPLYQGQYEILLVPNITEIVYGRDVGYKITKLKLADEIESISATNIRKNMVNDNI